MNIVIGIQIKNIRLLLKMEAYTLNPNKQACFTIVVYKDFNMKRSRTSMTRPGRPQNDL